MRLVDIRRREHHASCHTSAHGTLHQPHAGHSCRASFGAAVVTVQQAAAGAPWLTQAVVQVTLDVSDPLPDSPELPDLPDLPELPELPELPNLPELGAGPEVISEGPAEIGETKPVPGRQRPAPKPASAQVLPVYPVLPRMAFMHAVLHLAVPALGCTPATFTSSVTGSIVHKGGAQQVTESARALPVMCPKFYSRLASARQTTCCIPDWRQRSTLCTQVHQPG